MDKSVTPHVNFGEVSIHEIGIVLGQGLRFGGGRGASQFRYCQISNPISIRGAYYAHHILTRPSAPWVFIPSYGTVLSMVRKRQTLE